MKRIHPTACRAAHLAALAVSIAVVGCQANSDGAVNPFLAPNRVPPPATRAIAPGQAQPYYPGDPLPVMQSHTTPHVDGNGLAWGGPSSGAPATSPSASPAAIAPEAMVAVPPDNDTLRFALPSPREPAPFAPASAAPMPLAGSAPAQVVPQPDYAVVPPPPSPQPIAQASYTEPVLQPFESPAANPWRKPQIAQRDPPALQVGQPMNGPIASAAPLVAMPQNMAVTLRAVPPPGPGEATSPRIRLPGQAVAQTAGYDGFRPRGSMR